MTTAKDAATSPDQVWETLRARVEGSAISDRQLAGNSISLWVDMTPGEQQAGRTIWLDPSWSIVGPSGVLAGSMQAQDEDDDSGWIAVSNTLDTLVGKTIKRAEIEPITGDLILRLDGGVIIRTHATDPRETRHWRIKDYEKHVWVSGSSHGLSAGVIDPSRSGREE